MTLDEQLEILQAAKRGEKIECQSGLYWYPVDYVNGYEFDFAGYDYRIADPYAELKAAAKDPTKQIRLKGNNNWVEAGYKWSWCSLPEEYEIRDKPKAKKVVKYLCYEAQHQQLLWFSESVPITPNLKRRPAFDKECEVEDD